MIDDKKQLEIIQQINNKLSQASCKLENTPTNRVLLSININQLTVIKNALNAYKKVLKHDDKIRGEWLFVEDLHKDYIYWKCSNCGRVFMYGCEFNFCPECSAEMGVND